MSAQCIGLAPDVIAPYAGAIRYRVPRYRPRQQLWQRSRASSSCRTGAKEGGRVGGLDWMVRVCVMRGGRRAQPQQKGLCFPTWPISPGLALACQLSTSPSLLLCSFLFLFAIPQAYLIQTAGPLTPSQLGSRQGAEAQYVRSCIQVRYSYQPAW